MWSGWLDSDPNPTELLLLLAVVASGDVRRARRGSCVVLEGKRWNLGHD